MIESKVGNQGIELVYRLNKAIIILQTSDTRACRCMIEQRNGAPVMGPTKEKKKRKSPPPWKILATYCCNLLLHPTVFEMNQYESMVELQIMPDCCPVPFLMAQESILSAKLSEDLRRNSRLEYELISHQIILIHLLHISPLIQLATLQLG